MVFSSLRTLQIFGFPFHFPWKITWQAECICFLSYLAFCCAQDRESGWLDQGSSPVTEDVNNSRNGSIITGNLGSAGNTRLPGTVLLARERLLQRLRGVSLSTNRLVHKMIQFATFQSQVVSQSFLLSSYLIRCRTLIFF